MKLKRFIFLEHTADIKFQAFGKNIEEVFENSALALKESIYENIKVKKKIKKKIIVNAKDNEGLLYRFLEEFLYLLDAEDFLFSNVAKIKIKNNKLTAKISGDKASNYKFTNNVKAITYNEMFVKEQDGKWIAQVVIDV